VIKFKFHNKLVDNYLIIAWLTPIIFGITFPIATKLKGLLFATSVISGLILLQRIAGLLQPIIYKSKITLKILMITLIFIEILWSINIIYYIYSKNYYIFLYSHITLNIILDILYTSLSFKLDKIIATLVDLEEYKVTDHTIATIAGIITGIIITPLLIFETNIPYLLIISAIINILMQYYNYIIYKELKCLS